MLNYSRVEKYYTPKKDIPYITYVWAPLSLVFLNRISRYGVHLKACLLVFKWPTFCWTESIIRLQVNGMTPMHLACKNNCRLVVQTLISSPNQRLRKYFGLNILDKVEMTALEVWKVWIKGKYASTYLSRSC